MESFIYSKRRILVFLVLFILAVLRICIFEWRINSDVNSIDNKEPQTVILKVTALPSATTAGAACFGKIVRGLPVKSGVYVSIRNLSPEEISIGDTLRARVKAFVPQGPLNKGGYDFRGYLKSRGASVVLSCHRDDIEILKEGILRPIYRVRSGITGHIFNTFPHEEAALINALVTGSKDEMSPLQKENFRKAGVYHIIAVSGLHLGLLLMFLMASFAQIKLKSSGRNLLTLALTLIGGLFLLVFTGFGISVQRAAFMALFLCGANFFSRDYSPTAALLFALTLVVFINPASLLDPSCQLSFGATYGIVLAVPYFKKIPFKNKILKAMAESVIISVASSVTTLPFIVYHFGSVSLVAVVSNLIILTIVPLLLLLSYIFSISVLVAPFVATGFISYILAPVSASVNSLADIMASVPFGYISLSFSAMILIAVEVLGLIAAAKIKTKKLMCAFAAVFVVANIAFVSYNILGDKVTVSFLRVGQGDCTVIHSNDGSTFMIDCGSESDFSIGPNEIKPYLESIGADTIDALFITHYHTDHTSGAGYLIETGMVKSIILPHREPEKDQEANARMLLNTAVNYNVPVHYVSSGDYITLGKKHRFDIIHPEKNYESDANNSSMALYYTYKDSKVLFMGDTESKAHLLLAKKLEKCDIIKLSHHGGKSVMSKSIYSLTKPRYAVVSCGENNYYSHPAEDTLRAFKNCRILRTDTWNDTIEIVLKNGKIKER